MTPKQIAREKVIAAALWIVQARVTDSFRAPGPNDDADDEYADDVLHEAMREYFAEEQRERDQAVFERNVIRQGGARGRLNGFPTTIWPVE